MILININIQNIESILFRETILAPFYSCHQLASFHFYQCHEPKVSDKITKEFFNFFKFACFIELVGLSKDNFQNCQICILISYAKIKHLPVSTPFSICRYIKKLFQKHKLSSPLTSYLLFFFLNSLW